MPPYNWQKANWQRFISEVQDERVSHAYLLIGESGTGIEKFASAMAHYLLCHATLNDVVCNKCRSCELIKSQSHGDFLSIEPEEKSTQIKVDQIRSVSDFVAKTSLLGKRKIVLLQPADLMNLNAANALLKNLEEPPGETVFILVSSEPHKLLPTIKSRCRIIELPLPSKEESTLFLKESGIDETEELLEQVGGAPLIAKEWFHNGTVEERKKIVTGLVDLSCDATKPIILAKKWSKLEPDLILHVLLNMVEVLIYHFVANKTCMPFYEPVLRKLSSNSVIKLFVFRDKLCEKRSLLSGPFNLNTNLVLEELLLDWYMLLESNRKSELGIKL